MLIKKNNENHIQKLFGTKHSIKKLIQFLKLIFVITH